MSGQLKFEQIMYKLTFQYFPRYVFNIINLDYFNRIINYLFDVSTESGILNVFLLLLHNFINFRPFIFVEQHLKDNGKPDAIVISSRTCQCLDLSKVVKKRRV